MQSHENSLSRRGRQAASEPLRADFDLFAEAMENHYHPDDNPDGCLPLCIAENLLNWTEMEAKLRTIASETPTPDWVASYTSILGAFPSWGVFDLVKQCVFFWGRRVVPAQA